MTSSDTSIVFLLKNNSFNDPVDRLRGNDIITALQKKGWNAQYFDEQDNIDILIALDLDFKTNYIINRYPHKKLILDIQDDFLYENTLALKKVQTAKKSKLQKALIMFNTNGLYPTLTTILYKYLSKKSAVHLIKKADYVITSSFSLEKILIKMNKNILTIPDSLDARIYNNNNNNNNNNSQKNICWIGTPSNIKYLLLVNNVIHEIQKKHNVNFKIITSEKIYTDINIKEIISRFKFKFEFIKWKKNTFADEVSACDIGIAPLPKGIAKSTNKILTYMACNLAVICSGSYDYEVLHEKYPDALIYEDTHDGWYSHLDSLLSNDSKLENYSNAAMTVVKQFYTDEIVKKYESLFMSLNKSA